MSLKPLRLLSTFCWYSWWGLRRPHVFLFLFLSSQLQKTPETPFPFWQQLQFGPQPALFLLWFFLAATLRPAGSLQVPPAPGPFPLGHCPHPHACSYSLHSKMWCFDFFSVFCIVFVFLFWIFSFPTKIMPRKNKFCMFPAVSSHLRIYHLHLSVFYSLCKNWPI